nr:hypothetical protein [Acinetobacter tandoii]
MKKIHRSNSDQFDQIVLNRILSEDFGQPKLPDLAFYKNRAVKQIGGAISAMRNATSQHDFTTATAQANAFIDAALDYEFIDLSEKAVWLDEMATILRIQTIGESA